MALHRPEPPLAFVVRFVTMDLAHCRPGDWLNLRDDLQQFLTAGQMQAHLPDTATISLAELVQLQLAVRHLLEGTPLTMTLEVAYTPPTCTLHGSLSSVVLAQVATALRQDGAQLADCDECGALFYRVKNQVYCSRLCTNRVGQRRFRARQTATRTARDA